ncbi:MAG: DUF1858 domain-containing protein [Candidatus Nealsonbacteria bacterium]|nr:DUF1858 domain-containing protein [Candidatus Nealsonbacteria bacterium]
MPKSNKITKETTIAEVTKNYPKTAPILMGYGLYCAGCPMAQSETIEELAKNNQFNLKELLEALNKAASK